MGALIHRKFRDSNYEKGQGESQRQGKVRKEDGELFDNPQENDCLPAESQQHLQLLETFIDSAVLFFATFFCTSKRK